MVANTLIGNWDRSMSGGRANNSPLPFAKYCHDEGFAHHQSSQHLLQGHWSVGIYFVTDAMNQENMISTLSNEWMRLGNNVHRL